MSLTFGEANNIYQDHVAWLSRLQVIRTHNHRLPVFAKTLLEIEILWEGASLRLFATHLRAFSSPLGGVVSSTPSNIKNNRSNGHSSLPFGNQLSVRFGDFGIA